MSPRGQFSTSRDSVCGRTEERGLRGVNVAKGECDVEIDADPGEVPERQTVTSADPRYLDPKYWPTPRPGESIIEARLEQCAAIDEDRQRKGSRDRVQRVRPDRLGNPSHFPDLLPWRPFATNGFEEGVYRVPRRLAQRRRYLQLNPRTSVGWLVFDIDRDGAHEAAEQADLPEPTFVAVNRENGHAHLAWLLKTPVHRYGTARQKPIAFLAGVERGMMRRLGADRSYGGLLVKNPLNAAWATEWRSPMPFTLESLDANLMREDKKRGPIAQEAGLGRNCTVFEELRERAYQDVRKFFAAREAFSPHLLNLALAINNQFENKLSIKEITVICGSVARWTLRNFSPERFSDIQRERAEMRWKNHRAESTDKPWATEGISRRTYYYRKALNRA